MTEKSGNVGFLTASHCTNTWWGPDSSPDDFAQNVDSAGNYVGVEDMDPTPYSCGDPDDCRKTDSAFIDKYAGVTYELGYIARTMALGDQTIDSSPDHRYRITDEGMPFENDDLERTGKRTGRDEIHVEDVCTDVKTTGDPLTVCEVEVSGNSGLTGDSGGPVYEITSGNDVTIMGVFHTIAGTTAYFSEIGQVYGELGLSDTWDSCYTGC